MFNQIYSMCVYFILDSPEMTVQKTKITLLRVIPTNRETTGGSLGLELAAIHRGDDWRESGAGAGGYT